jgi:hypothetical protein
MLERSREMMHHLKKLGVGKNPIIWVGHSKGGLFVKQMIVDGKYHFEVSVDRDSVSDIWLCLILYVDLASHFYIILVISSFQL